MRFLKRLLRYISAVGNWVFIELDDNRWSETRPFPKF